MFTFRAGNSTGVNTRGLARAPVVGHCPAVERLVPLRKSAAPAPPFLGLDTLWFQVAGTVCNLACTHCFISCSPSNHTHEMLDLATVRRVLAEAAALGVKEYYFTGGEPFLNRE